MLAQSPPRMATEQLCAGLGSSHPWPHCKAFHPRGSLSLGQHVRMNVSGVFVASIPRSENDFIGVTPSGSLSVSFPGMILPLVGASLAGFFIIAIIDIIIPSFSVVLILSLAPISSLQFEITHQPA